MDSHGTKLRANDDWKAGQRAELKRLGLAPTEDAESAVLVDLPAGFYTAIVRGKQNTTGLGLVEIYNVE